MSLSVCMDQQCRMKEYGNLAFIHSVNLFALKKNGISTLFKSYPVDIDMI